MENRIIFDVAVMLTSGILFGSLVKQFKSPNVTGYLIAGLLLGPSVLNIITSDMVNSFTIISDIALSFIAFSIGSKFDMNHYKEVGMAPIIIAIAESGGAIILVTGTLILLGFDKNFSIMLGATAAILNCLSCTAPFINLFIFRAYLGVQFIIP